MLLLDIGLDLNQTRQFIIHIRLLQTHFWFAGDVPIYRVLIISSIHSIRKGLNNQTLKVKQSVGSSTIKNLSNE